MKLAIWGAGSLGTIIGAYITKNNMPVDLISRNIKHIEGLKKKGAQIIGTVKMTVPVKALLPEEVTDKYDIIFLITKQQENIKTIQGLVPFLKDDGVICTMQNGLPELAVSKVIGENRTFGCAIEWGATLIGEGICELTSEPDSLTFKLGSFGSSFNENKMNQIKSILDVMGTVEIESNFIGARWSKILINSSFSGMSAVTGCTFGEVAKNKSSRLCIQRIIKECIDIAKSANIKIEPAQGKDIAGLLDYKNKLKEKFIFIILPVLISKHKLLKASMLQDLEKGKKSEVDSINGIVSEYGKKYNVATPYNDMVVNVIHKIERGETPLSIDNLSFFKGLK
jgi:2-dehydropantoate 2-reductase